MYKAAINICVQVSIWIYVFISFGYISMVEFLGHIVILCLTFCYQALVSG